MTSLTKYKVLKEASTIVLEEVAQGNKVRIPGFGEFYISAVSYRDPADGELKKTKTLRFRPFTAAKAAAKGAPPSTTTKVTKQGPSSTESALVATPPRAKKPVKVVPPKIEKPASTPAAKKSPFSFSLTGPKASK